MASGEKDSECLLTREQRYKQKRYNDMYIERAVILSEAFKVLTATAIRVYLIFLTKRVVKPLQGKAARRTGKGKYYIENQGQIEFRYSEAEKYGIRSAAFRDAIDQLVAVGLIDIAQQGSGVQKDVTLYALSDRWRLYGMPEFVVRTRPKRRIQCGFQKGNRLGKVRKVRESQL